MLDYIKNHFSIAKKQPHRIWLLTQLESRPSTSPFELSLPSLLRLMQNNQEEEKYVGCESLMWRYFPEVITLSEDIQTIDHAGKSERGRTWPIQVAKLTSNLDFPLYQDEARHVIKGVDVKGEDVGQIMDRLDFPINSPADLIDKISRATG